jgi:hypothetical protein
VGEPASLRTVNHFKNMHNENSGPLWNGVKSVFGLDKAKRSAANKMAEAAKIQTGPPNR